jgi:hypothetical protein
MPMAIKNAKAKGAPSATRNRADDFRAPGDILEWAGRGARAGKTIGIDPLGEKRQHFQRFALSGCRSIAPFQCGS